MIKFFTGVVIGLNLMGLITLTFLLQLTGVQQELVEQGYDTYHPTTGKFTLKECK